MEDYTSYVEQLRTKINGRNGLMMLKSNNEEVSSNATTLSSSSIIQTQTEMDGLLSSFMISWTDLSMEQQQACLKQFLATKYKWRGLLLQHNTIKCYTFMMEQNLTNMEWNGSQLVNVIGLNYDHTIDEFCLLKTTKLNLSDYKIPNNSLKNFKLKILREKLKT